MASSIAKLPTRTKALGLYKRIMRTAKTWEGPVEESEYIVNEAQTLFRKNKNIVDPSKIDDKILEAEQRLEIGSHYKIPYPKLHNMPPESTRKGANVTPAYMDSYRDEENLV